MNRQWKTHHMLCGSTEVAVEETADKTGIYLEIHEDSEHSARIFLDYSALWEMRMLLGTIDVRPMDSLTPKEKKQPPGYDPTVGGTILTPNEVVLVVEEGWAREVLT